MTIPKIVLKDQYGDETDNYVLPGGTTLPGAAPVAAHTVMANVTGSSATPSAVALQTFANDLPPNAAVAAITPLATPVSPITIALSTSNTYTDAAVNAAVNAALASAVADLQAQLTQMNAILAALQSS
jgi:hypothetical protein